MTHYAPTWTPDQVAVLTKRWNEGLSAAKIAAEIGGGVTKNAVVSKVHRVGLSPRPSPIKGARPKPPKPIKPPRMRVARPVPRGTVSSLRPAPTSTPVIASNGGAGVAFSELRGAACRWPLWGNERPDEFRFCGHATDGRSYCGAHHARAHAPKQQPQIKEAA